MPGRDFGLDPVLQLAAGALFRQPLVVMQTSWGCIYPYPYDMICLQCRQ